MAQKQGPRVPKETQRDSLLALGEGQVAPRDRRQAARRVPPPGGTRARKPSATAVYEVAPHRISP